MSAQKGKKKVTLGYRMIEFLGRRFDELDKDKSGSLTLDELFALSDTGAADAERIMGKAQGCIKLSQILIFSPPHSLISSPKVYINIYIDRYLALIFPPLPGGGELNFIHPCLVVEELKAGGDYVIGRITFPCVRVCVCVSVSNLGFPNLGFQGFKVLKS